MYIQRQLEQSLHHFIQNFPAVAVIGPRQAGKTTLVQQIVKTLDKESIYLDLENPADYAVLEYPLEFLNNVQQKTIIIDEVQRKPELFPVLRVAIDSNRVNGRFVLLGSASRELLFLSNETLAGRIVYTELSPFFLNEIIHLTGFREHWLRGGFPPAFIQPDQSLRQIWYKSFVSAYIERDLRMLGLNNSPSDIQRLLYMVASLQGNMLNSSSLGNSIGLNAVSVRSILSFFEKSFIIRLLQPWHMNLGKRLVKTPKIYIRDSGIINFLLNINSYENLLMNPMLGHLWEGYVIENIINSLGDEYQYYFYRTSDGTECDLLIFRGLQCIAVIDAKFSPNPSRTKSMTITMQDLNPQKAFFIIPECHQMLS